MFFVFFCGVSLVVLLKGGRKDWRLFLSSVFMRDERPSCLGCFGKSVEYSSSETFCLFVSVTSTASADISMRMRVLSATSSLEV